MLDIPILCLAIQTKCALANTKSTLCYLPSSIIFIFCSSHNSSYYSFIFYILFHSQKFHSHTEMTKQLNFIQFNCLNLKIMPSNFFSPAYLIGLIIVLCAHTFYTQRQTETKCIQRKRLTDISGCWRQMMTSFSHLVELSFS